MTFHVSPLPNQDAFGAMVTGLSPGDIDDTAVRQALNDLWTDKGLIVFRGLEGLETQIRLSWIFGRPVEHTIQQGVTWPRAHQLIVDIEYDDSRGEGDIYEVDGEILGAWLPWHSDGAYVAEINRGGILRPVKLPPYGGETGFIDQIEAYEALSSELKRRIENLNVLYRYDADASRAKFGRSADSMVRISEKFRRAVKHKAILGRSVHPMVYTQAETGRKVLNISPWWADAIEGMENAEGDALLREVINHCINPARAYFHTWRMDDMLLWDNWRLIHCANGVPVGMPRHMQRTTIAGDYGLGRVEGVATA